MAAPPLWVTDANAATPFSTRSNCSSTSDRTDVGAATAARRPGRAGLLRLSLVCALAWALAKDGLDGKDGGLLVARLRARPPSCRYPDSAASLHTVRNRLLQVLRLKKVLGKCVLQFMDGLCEPRADEGDGRGRDRVGGTMRRRRRVEARLGLGVQKLLIDNRLYRAAFSASIFQDLRAWANLIASLKVIESLRDDNQSCLVFFCAGPKSFCSHLRLLRRPIRQESHHAAEQLRQAFVP